jgi:hypothetical protein
MKRGAMMGEGKGMRTGWHPLRGGEVVDGEAVGLCDASALGREVAAAACSGKEKGGAGLGRAGWEAKAKRSGGGQAIRADWAKKVGWANLAARAETKKEFLSEF